MSWQSRLPPELLWQAAAQSPLLVALFDEQDVLQYANPSFCHAYGVAEGEQLSWANLMRRNHAQREGSLIETDDIETWLHQVSARRGKLPVRSFEADLCDGRWIWMTETLLHNGWMLCQACDVTQLRHDERALRQALQRAVRDKQTDTLTQISSRSHILRLLQRDLKRLAVSGRPLCLAVLDLDHFKQINDQYGHPFGDRVLVNFAARVQRQLRRSDRFGRLGGEEFLLILPDLQPHDATTVLTRLCEDIAQPVSLGEQPVFRYTVSIGLTLAHPDETADRVYARADRALYLAKQGGRNRVMALG